MNNKYQIPIITLDGPSGTGKGTICHLLAKHLGWNVLDSGAIYRVLAHAAMQRQILPEQTDRLVELARNLPLRFVFAADGKQRVLLDDEDVTEAIRTELCGQTASRIAAIPEIRTALLARQRAFATAPGLVTDGRDMGTVVFPDASIKIYLDASAEERAKRRFLQLKNSGSCVSLAQVIDELNQRDARDQARSHAPLRPAADAVTIDTTGLDIVQVMQTVLKLIGERLEMNFGKP